MQSAAAALNNSQDPTPAHTPEPELPTSGVAQMIVDPETGQLIIDPASLTMQAQAPMQYLRREDNDDVLVNSMSHMRREPNTRWTPEETEEFYAVSSTLYIKKVSGLACYSNQASGQRHVTVIASSYVATRITASADGF